MLDSIPGTNRKPLNRNYMKFTNLKSVTEHFANGGRSATLESADGTAINCSSLEEAKAFYKDHPEVKEKKADPEKKVE